MALSAIVALLALAILAGIVIGAKFHAWFVEDAKAVLAEAQRARDEANALFQRVETGLAAKHSANAKAPPR